MCHPPLADDWSFPTGNALVCGCLVEIVDGSVSAVLRSSEVRTSMFSENTSRLGAHSQLKETLVRVEDSLQKTKVTGLDGRLH